MDPRLQLCGLTLTEHVFAAQRKEMTSVDGRLGLALFDDQYVQNPHRLYEEMHRVGHVHRIGESGFYAVSSWDAVNEAVGRCGDFSSNLTATMMYQSGGTVAAFEVGQVGGATQALATADEPVHFVHRKALLPQLAAKRIGAFEPFIADTAAHIWNANAQRGRIEWMAAMANRLPMMIVGADHRCPRRRHRQTHPMGLRRNPSG
jgi:cytochrome P450